jgi:hypothetical protein
MPNRTRRSFNPKRALVAVKPQHAELIALADKVTYGGNPEHKSSPGDFGLTPPSAPRGDKTLCDKAGIRSKAEALTILRSGVRKGLISRQIRGRDRFPQNIWAVSDDGIAFEAQLENPETGSYHGYPMPGNDDFRTAIVQAWSTT